MHCSKMDLTKANVLFGLYETPGDDTLAGLRSQDFALVSDALLQVSKRNPAEVPPASLPWAFYAVSRSLGPNSFLLGGTEHPKHLVFVTDVGLAVLYRYVSEEALKVLVQAFVETPIGKADQNRFATGLLTPVAWALTKPDRFPGLHSLLEEEKGFFEKCHKLLVFPDRTALPASVMFHCWQKAVPAMLAELFGPRPNIDDVVIGTCVFLGRVNAGLYGNAEEHQQGVAAAAEIRKELLPLLVKKALEFARWNGFVRDLWKPAIKVAQTLSLLDEDAQLRAMAEMLLPELNAEDGSNDLNLDYAVQVYAAMGCAEGAPRPGSLTVGGKKLKACPFISESIWSRLLDIARRGHDMNMCSEALYRAACAAVRALGAMNIEPARTLPVISRWWYNPAGEHGLEIACKEALLYYAAHGNGFALDGIKTQAQ